LEDQLGFFRKHSPAYAEQLGERVFARVANLRHSPKIGRVVPEFGDDAIRELIVPPLRVIYTLRAEDRCFIGAVIHSSRDLPGWIRPEDLAGNEA